MWHGWNGLKLKMSEDKFNIINILVCVFARIYIFFIQINCLFIFFICNIR